MRILKFLYYVNQLFPDYQSAYCKLHSSETVVLKLLNDIPWNMEHKQTTSLVASDLTTALLSQALQHKFGVTNLAPGSFNTYLMPRDMHVKVNSARSSSRNISCSGTELFTAYASTLSESVLDPSTSLMEYANDHIIYRSFSPQNGESASVTSLQLRNGCITTN